MKLVNILNENMNVDDLNTPLNRRLLNTISKNNDISKIKSGHYKSFLNQSDDIIRFMSKVLVLDYDKISELLLLILINGDIDYLNDDMKTLIDFNIYETYHFEDIGSRMDSDYVECYDCDGYGETEDRCQMCDGEGEVGEWDDEGEKMMVDCSDCNDGFVSKTCDYCYGSGEVGEEEEVFYMDEYETVFISQDDIPKPSTINTPFNQSGKEDNSDPINFDDWQYENQDKLNLIYNIKIDTIEGEAYSELSDEEGKITSFFKVDPVDFMRKNLKYYLEKRSI